jgi:hypothetical protein
VGAFSRTTFFCSTCPGPASPELEEVGEAGERAGCVGAGQLLELTRVEQHRAAAHAHVDLHALVVLRLELLATLAAALVVLGRQLRALGRFTRDFRFRRCLLARFTLETGKVLFFGLVLLVRHGVLLAG